jgi:copper(I)-binding protein
MLAEFYMKNNGRNKVKNIKNIFFTALIIMAFSTPVLSLETKGVAVPVVEISAPEYRFESVPEGAKVTHAYIVHNRGNAPLEVLKVKTG